MSSGRRAQHPFGSWASSIRAEQIAAGAVRLGQPQLGRDAIHWLEGRPAEGGRQVVVRAGLDAADRAARDASPAGTNVRTLVHEYGGGDYLAVDTDLFFVDFSDQRVYCQRSGEVRALTPSGARHADFALSPDRRWLLAVEERPREQGEPENRLVAIDVERARRGAPLAAPRVIAAGHDFYSFPRWSPAGDRVAFTAWDHPDMPWDATRLYRSSWGSDGAVGDPVQLAGGGRESILEPVFSPAGVLTFVSDRSGWWNLYQLREDAVVPLIPASEEFAGPQWNFATAHYAFEAEDVILCVRRTRDGDRLGRLRVSSGRLEDIVLPYTSIAGLQVSGGRAAFVAGRAERPAAVALLDLASGACDELAVGSSSPIDPVAIARPESIEFESVNGRTAYAYYYAPHNPGMAGPEGERPPLLVKSHGGPTAAASTVLDPRIQYWTSRGIAVVDVDYGGSTGYGRAYRDSLRGQWGVIDVEDCIAAAQHLAHAGLADPQRLAISGGSAGGYTTLCALTFHDVFAAGASHYGIADLEALARDTHKFEARYTDGLVGPYPEARALYRARSPIHAPDRLGCPVIFFQGLEDRIVPPNQAEAMVAALAARGIAHAYVPFPGEQHGFRRAENVVTALRGELYFYSKIFGFDCGDAPPGVEIVAG